MNTSGKYIEVNIENEMKRSYLDYAMSVIIGRALPNVRDGLKPVHRRIFYGMYALKNDWNKAYKKSARVVGDVIGKYHPHGDTAVYDTIVRMAQDFSLRYPLVDGQGNFGSVDGDSAAAMRYTEVRLARLAHEILEDLDKETVDFTLNYDESLSEPSVLPARLPNLLVNGSSGIAVGMATNIPPHNLTEVINATIAFINNPDISANELMKHLPGPDFPTSGIIYGSKGIESAYKTGRGIIRIRARLIVEKDRRTGRESIVVTEIPYQVNKARLVEKIAALVRDKHIQGVKYVRDESDREGMRIVVALKKDQVPGVVVNQLYAHTRMESSFGIILLAIVDQQPRLLTLKQLIVYFVEHRKEIIVRRTQFELNKAEARAHILEGLKTALDNIDAVISIIRSSKNPAEAKERLISSFQLTDTQSQAILDMRLQRLTGLERDKIEHEYKELIKAIVRYEEILASERLVLNIIKDELEVLQKQYGDERRTEIIKDTEELTIEDMITEEDMVVTISHAGYIKRNPVTLYNSQHRGGRGKTGVTMKEEDFVDRLFVASTHDTFLFFTNLGRVYWRKVHELPQAGRTARGKAIVNLLALEEQERVATVLAVRSFDPGNTVLMATKGGTIKKTDLMAYSRPRTGGIIALNLAQNDELIAVRITDGTQNVFLGSKYGKSIRFHESGVRTMGRVSRGIRGINLTDDDCLVGMEVLTDSETLMTITENGYGKRTSIDEYPLQKRGGMGVITIKTTERNGMVVAILLVTDDDDVMLISDRGKIIRMPVKDISIIGRNTQGIRLIRMSAGERVTSAARLAEKDV
ncbi:MAG: DNA gyrase subunit A [Candidatus Gerdarchaeota archaeon]|nr:MAG: DNA gyrase subunit A [Candidatus Gerdarchaeota archaeon]